jgi:hypothetical protein
MTAMGPFCFNRMTSGYVAGFGTMRPWRISWVTTSAGCLGIELISLGPLQSSTRRVLWELCWWPDLLRTTGEEPMSDAPGSSDGPITRSRCCARPACREMIWDLVHETAGTSLRTPEVEEAHQAALVAISVLAKTPEEEGFAAPVLWKTVFGATESWIELLD